MSNSLKLKNTFGIQQNAKKIILAKDIQQLLNAWRNASNNNEPVLILGEGSNVLFLDDFDGTVIINRIMGIEVIEQIDSWHLCVGAGENWHQLVQFTLKNGMAGLENLALIPGCVGSSPIQNIGAYGVELKSVCEYVDCIELATGDIYRLTAKQCKFRYRDSIFKHEYQDRFVIVAVGLCLIKHWSPILTHDDLTSLDPQIVTPRDIFNVVCHMRTNKLPDPKVQGNAGSFFKNPVIGIETARTLLKRWPKIPHYQQPDGTVKLAAGWLIDQCHLKGVVKGGAAVHQQQALVLINQHHATSTDVLQLAYFVRQSVGEKFNIWLEPEVRFIGRTGEVNAVETILSERYERSIDADRYFGRR